MEWNFRSFCFSAWPDGGEKKSGRASAVEIVSDWVMK